MQYRKKPVVIEARQWDGTARTATPIIDWILQQHGETATYQCDSPRDCPNTEHRIAIPTLEGTMTADEGDWIIRGVQGEFYPCKPDIFDATYEPVEG